jgi:hypothetical protein
MQDKCARNLLGQLSSVIEQAEEKLRIANWRCKANRLHGDCDACSVIGLLLEAERLLAEYRNGPRDGSGGQGD